MVESSDDFYEKQALLDESKSLLLSAKESIKGIYEFKDLISYIDIALDEIRNLEKEYW